MPEVIDLLSSSPVSRAKLGHSSASRSDALQPTHLQPRLDDVDSTSEFEFSTERRSKKRKLASTCGKDGREDGTPWCIEVPSDDDILPVNRSSPIQIGPVFKSTALADIEHIDDIIFSSSARGPRRKTSATNAPAVLDLSSDSLPDNPLDGFAPSSYQPRTTPAPAVVLSERTANTLGSPKKHDSQPGKSSRTQAGKPSSHTYDRQKGIPPRVRPSHTEKPIISDVDDILFSSSPSHQKKASISSRGVERARASAPHASKRAEREAEKAQRLVDKERKAQQRQKAAEIAEVNKSRTNKKITSAEMILDMPSFLEGTSVGTQVEEYMKQLQVEINYFDEDVDLRGRVTKTTAEQSGSIVKWRRKITAAYNNDEAQWEPLSTSHIDNERHVLVYLTAAEFAATAARQPFQPSSTPSPFHTEATLKANLDSHVASIRSRHRDCIPIYLIEGLTTWLRKSQNAKNRAYTAAVRAQMLDGEDDPAAAMPNSSAPASSQGRLKQSKKPAAPMADYSFMTPDVAENLLLHLQLAHQPILIQHTTSPENTASRISAFTQHLSTRPYRLAQLEYNLKFASFCMDAGQVRTGDNAEETYVKMLQEVQRVTPSMAYGIAARWPGIRDLVAGFREEGNLMLEDVKKSVNKDGGWSDRRLGPMVSRRLYKVFMGRDPAATDGMS